MKGTGNLFTFHPNPTYGPSPHQRSRSGSPAPISQRKPRRRRMFESFGVVPAIAPSSAKHDPEEDLSYDHDSDSDEILNIPSLLVRGRVSSRQLRRLFTKLTLRPAAAALTGSQRIHAD